MNFSKLIVGAIWIFIVASGIFQGLTLPASPLARNVSFPWPVLVALPLIVVVGAFFSNEIPGEFSIGKRIDEKFGKETYRAFMKSLKLELLFSSMFFGIGIAGMARTLQLGGPNGAYPICGFFISAGCAFLTAHVIAFRRGAYDRSSEDAMDNEEHSEADAASFWRKARTRRNLCFAAWIAWLLAGPVLIALFSYLVPDAPEMTRAAAALVTWGVVLIWTQVRMRQLRCFRCRMQAFSSPLFFMKDAKCQNCGVKSKGP